MQPPPSVAGIRWRPGRADDADALTAVGAAADRVDVPGHPRTRDEAEQLLAVVDPSRAVLVGERAGRPVAFGARFRPGGGPVRLLGAVAPEVRGRGVGRALLAALLESARVDEPGAEQATVRSVGGGVAPLARRSGFAPAREFVTMRRDLALPVESAALPGGLRLAPFEAALDEPVRLVKNAVFRDHWQGLVDGPEEWRSRMLGPQLRRELSRIAVDADGAIAGFVLAWRVDQHPRRVHLPLVGTAAAHRGRGVARALLASMLAAAADAGLTEADLDVDATSPTGADRVYARAAFVEVSRATVWSRPLR